ncbi:MAG: hypothetical protein LRY66_08440 [Saccharospirillaceae bacterium]|nr:hypothetical protein [Saccharospirillaceae bacterium]MCD8531377.1 hypothetical protein [Saccharospirillaceae bacterium]
MEGRDNLETSKDLGDFDTEKDERAGHPADSEERVSTLSHSVRSGEHLDDDIEDALEVIQKDNPETADKMKHMLFAVQQTSHRGPMPSPADLRDYASVQKDLPERMMKMAEDALASKSRHNDALIKLKEQEIALRNKEAEVHSVEHKRETVLHAVRLVAAFIIALVCILGSFWMAIEGHEALAWTLGGATVTAIVASFLYRKISDNGKNSDE